MLALFAEMEVAAGRLDEGRAICSRLTEMAGESHYPLVRALAAYTAGVACRSAAQDDAIRHLKDALAGFLAAGLALEAARTRLELARGLEHGSPQVAAAEALAALACFDQLSAPRDADETASLLRRLGMPGGSWPRGRAALTKRELEVLALLGQGLSNDQIAARLYISLRTAEHHVSNILAKLGLARRSEATAYAFGPSRRPNASPSQTILMSIRCRHATTSYSGIWGLKQPLFVPASRGLGRVLVLDDYLKTRLVRVDRPHWTISLSVAGCPRRTSPQPPTGLPSRRWST